MLNLDGYALIIALLHLARLALTPIAWVLSLLS